MNHYAASSFWYHYRALPEGVQRVADKNYRLLESNPFHPSLHFKKIDADLWSARVGLAHRALAAPESGGVFLWFWIGPHDEYELQHAEQVPLPGGRPAVRMRNGKLRESRRVPGEGNPLAL